VLQASPALVRDNDHAGIGTNHMRDKLEKPSNA
jgi:hypothetical protein